MKQNSIFIGLSALTVCVGLLSGCSAEDMDVQRMADNGKEIRMTASMQQITRTENELQDAQLSQNVTVGVYGVSGENTISNGDNAGYTADGSGNLTTTDNTMTRPAAGSVTIYAYAPKQEAWTFSADKTFTVATDQSTDAGYLASDLLWAKATAESQTTVNLDFAHRLSRILLTVATDANTTLTDATVQIVNTKPSASFTLADGTVGTADGDATDITIGSDITLAAGGSTTLYGILIPQTVAANTALISITAGDRVWRYYFGEAKTFAAGKAYSATITISGSSFSSAIGSVTATEPAK